MKHRYIFLAIIAPLLLGACGIFKFGVGKVQDESEYKTVAVLEDGRTLLFSFTDRRIKREPSGLVWENRVIYLRDTKVLCALDLKTGKHRILKELQNNRHGAPYGDLEFGVPHGNKILVSHTERDKKTNESRRKYFLFDGDTFAQRPKAALKELKGLESDRSQMAKLVDSEGTILVLEKGEMEGTMTEDMTIIRPEGQIFHLGKTSRPLSFVAKDFVCFRDMKDLAWHSASTKTGEIRRLQGSPSTAGLHREEYQVRAVKRPEHKSDRLLVWTRMADGEYSEKAIQPHLALRR